MGLVRLAGKARSELPSGMPIISGSIRERASKDDVPLDCRTLHGLGFPCTLQLPSVHEASWLSAYVRVKHTPREPHQGCPQACVDTARMLLFWGLLCTPCSNGWPQQTEEPYYRNVRMPAAGAVSVGRDIMPGTTLKPHGNRLVAIVTKNRVSAVRCPHAIRLSYRQ